jgi:serine/threonine-protein kinase
LKPENIFLCQMSGMKDYPKVLDFGLAKVGERQMRPGSIILTQEGMVFGTPEFMSPEQAQGKTLTPASDIYSLATILYEVLTGKLPFDAKSPMDYIQLHVTGRPILLSQRVQGKVFPPLLEQIIDRALAKHAEDRFVSAADFGAALQCVLQGATQLPLHLMPKGSADELATVPAGRVHADEVRAAAAQQRAQAPSAPQPASTPMQDLGRPQQHGAAKFASEPVPAPPKSSVGLLIGVAAAFLVLGVVIAIVVMKLVMQG